MRHSPYYNAYEGLLDDLEDSGSIRLLDTLKDVFVISNDDTITHSRLTSCHCYICSEIKRHIQEIGSILEVYSEAIKNCINLSGTLDTIIRSWADRIRITWQEGLIDPELRLAVPIWIPVLGDMPFAGPKSRTMARINAESLVGNPSQGIFNAHYESTPNVRFDINDETTTYSGSLLAKGMMLGNVEQVSTRMASGIASKECLEMIRCITVDDGGQIPSISESIWRILCANRNADGGPLPPLYRMALFHLLQGSRGVCSIDTGELLALIPTT
ncbi:putative Heterokaryon incompatibility domain-containing protein [Seiridium cardinale]